MKFRAKYVIVNDSAIVFFEGIAHSEMVKNKLRCQGAGFVDFYHEKNEYGKNVVLAKCFGESIGLGIKSREEEDSFIINRQLLSHC